MTKNAMILFTFMLTAMTSVEAAILERGQAKIEGRMAEGMYHSLVQRAPQSYRFKRLLDGNVQNSYADDRYLCSESTVKQLSPKMPSVIYQCYFQVQLLEDGSVETVKN